MWQEDVSFGRWLRYQGVFFFWSCHVCTSIGTWPYVKVLAKPFWTTINQPTNWHSFRSSSALSRLPLKNFSDCESPWWINTFFRCIVVVHSLAKWVTMNKHVFYYDTVIVVPITSEVTVFFFSLSCAKNNMWLPIGPRCCIYWGNLCRIKSDFRNNLSNVQRPPRSLWRNKTVKSKMPVFKGTLAAVQ